MRLTVNFPRHQSDETTVILVRHAQSVSNLLACYPGCCEQDILTEKGRRSAYLTGLALKKFNIKMIKSFLSKVLNFSLNQLQNWQLYPEAIHAIYYPLEDTAIVQTVNYHFHL